MEITYCADNLQRRLGRRIGGLLMVVALLLGKLWAQTPMPSDFVVDLNATVSATAPHLRLSWTQRLQPNITAQRIHRRIKGGTAWTKLADLGLTTTSYNDVTAQVGVEYEYWMERTLNATPASVMPGTAVGYLSAGVNVAASESRGRLLLVIDSTLTGPLAGEIDGLQSDLVGDGWVVQRLVVSRTASVASVKALIKAAYAADPTQVRMVYLLGHVPVPYSGNNAPDGHANHQGAWAADGYYGDMNGVWGDSVVNNTGASNVRNDNVPGDGKFDPSILPSAVELAVGRVDLSGMTKSPSAAVSEVDLMRRYLAKAHAYRYQMGRYASIPRRTLIRDGLTQWMTGLTGWHWAYSGLGRPPGAPIDIAGSGQWFATNYAGGRSYLLGYAGGYSSAESMSGVGTTADFGTKPSGVVFLGMFGSYFGDWDSPNNLMRAVLAGNAAGDSLGLGCMWSGAPHYFMHPMGMGETIGYAVRASQNGPLPGGTALTPGGPRWGAYPPFGGVHTGLMGDPSLRLHVVEPPRNLAATSANGRVSLVWSASRESDLIGYQVYRAASPQGPFSKVSAAPSTSPTYTEMATAGQTYSYLVKTLVLERVPGGTYQNLSQGVPISIKVNGGAGTSVPPPPALGPFTLAWQIGRDDNPSVAGYLPYGEFSAENGLNDAPPGRVTRLAGDPLYSAAANPGRDDDFYCAGSYPVGFNGLMAALRVPTQEPAAAWEWALTLNDKTNRAHFILSSGQANVASRLRLNFEFGHGGFRLGAPINQMGVGFGQHDVVVRFRNANGVATVLYSNRVDRPTRASVEFTSKAVAAVAGASTIEFVRTGPAAPSTSYWILFDYVNLEAAIPTTSSVGALNTDISSGATGIQVTSVPVNFYSQAHGLASPDAVSQGIAVVDGAEYLTLTYSRPEPIPDGVLYRVEACGDMMSWSDSGVVEVDSSVEDGFRIITVRDQAPVVDEVRRFMRLHVLEDGRENHSDSF